MSKKANNIFAFTLLATTLCYGLFQARAIINGPELTIDFPLPGATVHDTLFIVRGATEHVTHVEVNGRAVTMDTDGNFAETLVTPSGYGVIVVEASDRFGNSAQQKIEFIGNPANS